MSQTQWCENERRDLLKTDWRCPPEAGSFFFASAIANDLGLAIFWINEATVMEISEARSLASNGEQ
jgi:hypothetical protein